MRGGGFFSSSFAPSLSSLSRFRAQVTVLATGGSAAPAAAMGANDFSALKKADRVAEILRRR